jgi:hypothetical protein
MKLYVDNRPNNPQYLRRKKIKLYIVYIIGVKRRKKEEKIGKRRKIQKDAVDR